MRELVDQDPIESRPLSQRFYDSKQVLLVAVARPEFADPGLLRPLLIRMGKRALGGDLPTLKQLLESNH